MHAMDKTYYLCQTLPKKDSLMSSYDNMCRLSFSPLHPVAESQTWILITPRIWKQIRKKLRYESGSKVRSFDEKNGGGKSHATVPLRDGKKQENSEKGELYTRNFRHWDRTDYGNTAYNFN